MGKVENIREGFYYSDGVNLLEITGNVPGRVDTYYAMNEAGEEVRIKKDKLYKIKLDEDWLSRLNIELGKEIYKDSNIALTLKKSGASFHLEINNLKEGAVKRKMTLTVDELQNQVNMIAGSMPKIR